MRLVSIETVRTAEIRHAHKNVRWNIHQGIAVIDLHSGDCATKKIRCSHAGTVSGVGGTIGNHSNGAIGFSSVLFGLLIPAGLRKINCLSDSCGPKKLQLEWNAQSIDTQNKARPPISQIPGWLPI